MSEQIQTLPIVILRQDWSFKEKQTRYFSNYQWPEFEILHPKEHPKERRRLHQDIQIFNFHLECLEGYLISLEDEGRFTSRYTSQDEDREQVWESEIQSHGVTDCLSV